MLTSRRVILLLLIIDFLLASVQADSKCANLFVTVKGVIRGPQNSALKIDVHVVPDPNSSLQPQFLIKVGNFEGSVLFDTTQSYGSKRHKCSRVPEKVRVVLLEGSSEIDSAWLVVANDFVKDKMGDYIVRSPVELHSEEKKQ